MWKIQKLGLGLLLVFAVVAHADPKMTVSTTAADKKGNFPVLYTCDGKDVSPEISWQNAPANTATFALTITDPDAPGGLFYHWILYNMPKETNHLDQGTEKLPVGTLEAANTWGKHHYQGPCPPKGSTHRYVISVYALNKPFDLGMDVDGDTLDLSLHGHVLQKAMYTVTYTRMGS